MLRNCNSPLPMPAHRDTTQQDYDRFIQQAREQGEVWGLRDGDDWAYCPSNEYEDTDVVLFWSSKAAAQLHAKDEWGMHKPVRISLENFVDLWLNGMHDDGTLAGPNWDSDLRGKEVEPEELAELLMAE